MNLTNKSNRLANEKNPYLLQHAYNPVDWYPWGEEAFEKAKEEDKPVFLSVGYSTCHWCHVMARESFEDEEVAEMMNKTFVNIKVDREERPDIDSVYMDVCQALTGAGGWPLTVIMTPDKKPFFAGTYFPKESVFGRIGMKDLITRVAELWNGKREDVSISADGLAERIKSGLVEAGGDGLDEDVIKRACESFVSTSDEEFGGFGDSPKFPSPHNYAFLLRYYSQYADEKAKEIVVKSLKEMQRGGIFDHIGFGFHRYSTDRRWKIPHFEKMLYDQAMLIWLYSEAYLASGERDFKLTAERTIDYVLSKLASPEGAFYSAEDADSEGEEGKFYLWTYDEAKRILDDDFDLFADVYNLKREGNVVQERTEIKDNENVLFRNEIDEELANKYGLTKNELEERIERAKKKLFEVREKREQPFLDDKILTDWNGLAIAALAFAGASLGVDKYIEAAERAFNFIERAMIYDDGKLSHRYKDGEAGVNGLIDDYAYLIWGALELYEASLKPKYLRRAIELTVVALRHFWDEYGGFYSTPDFGEKLIARKKEAYDGAVPSGNSVMAMNLLRLARLTSETDYEEKANELFKYFSNQVEARPSAYSYLLSALGFSIFKTWEIVAVEGKDGKARQMLDVVRQSYAPYKALLYKNNDNSKELEELAPYVADMKSDDGAAKVYVCSNFSCEEPTSDIEELKKKLI